MLQLFNHHCHSEFSDGKTSLEAFLIKADQENLISVGFSDHAPIPLPDMVGIPMHNLPSYFQEIDHLKDVMGEKLQIYKGLEVDYIPDLINVNSDYITRGNLDFTIGAIHYIDKLPDGTYWGFEKGQAHFEAGIREIFDGDIKEAISRYYQLIREMVANHPPDIVAHLDRIKKLNQGNRYFNEKDTWYQQQIGETLEVIAERNCILEVNTKGYYTGECDDTYPSKWVLEEAKSLNIAVHLASDAHHPDYLQGGFAFATAQLQSINYQKIKVMLDGQWQDSPLTKKPVHIF